MAGLRCKVDWNQGAVITAERTVSREAMGKIGAMVEARAKASMVSGWSGGEYTPSRPGEPPHVKTGALRASIHFAIGENDSEPASVRVYADAPYGLPLEFGTANVEARPWLRPAMVSNAGNFKNAFRGLTPLGRTHTAGRVVGGSSFAGRNVTFREIARRTMGGGAKLPPQITRFLRKSGAL